MEGGAELSRVSNDCYWQLCVISHTKKPGTGQAHSLNLDGAQRRTALPGAGQDGEAARRGIAREGDHPSNHRHGDFQSLFRTL